MLRRITVTTALASVALALTLTGCSSSSNTAGTDSAPAPASPAAGTTAETAETTEETTEPAPAEPQVPGLNTPVAVGTFEYTVTGLEELGTTIGEEPLATTAQGTYLKLDLSVTNVGNESEMFLDSYVTLVDNAGKRYDADSMAPIYLRSDSSWVSGINPGNTMSGPIVFDVPAGTVAEFLLVKENMFTDEGELIALS